MYGLEIGAVSVKWSKLNKDNENKYGIVRHEGNLIKKIKELYKKNIICDEDKVVVTGQSGKALLNLPYKTETECIEKGLAYYDLKPDIVLSLGGENFVLYTLKEGRIKNIISTSKCAAGTGEFIVQQLKRMNMSLKDGISQSKFGKLVPLASRCSVFCKSDATHKLNKGECLPKDIAKTLINDLALKVLRLIETAQWPYKKILVAGGITLNNEFVGCLKKHLKDIEVLKIEESPFLEAFGASIFAKELYNKRIKSKKPLFKNQFKKYDILKPLKEAESLIDYRVHTIKKKKNCYEGEYILGVDAGSTTTKAVLYNIKEKKIDASCYLRTHGNPVLATKNCIEELMNEINNTSIRIIQAAVTGSGRDITSLYLDNCLSFNEILAHARAAASEVKDIDTLFEIGGQDSKFISFIGGVPVDYAMNEGCSAGTGSFLEESVYVDMDIPVTEISSIAENSPSPIEFGERCAAFINTDLRDALQQGATKEDVVAGLVYSIAKNYISRIVGVRSIGNTVLFQGGVALNKSVALAIAAITKKKVVVPRYPELMGCIGAALMAIEMLHEKKANKKIYHLQDIVDEKMEEKESFKCSACENKCEIKKISLKEKIYPFGGLCSKYENVRRNKTKVNEGKDYIALRNKIMFEQFGPNKIKNPRGTIGLPFALTSYELFPFYSKLINELGYDIKISKIKNKKTMSKGAICYPCEIAHNAVYDLIEQDVDYIFLPYLIDGFTPAAYQNSYFCPNTNIISPLISETFDKIGKKILNPHIALSDKLIPKTINEICLMGKKIGLKKRVAIDAFKKAIENYKKFKKLYRNIGVEALKDIENEPGVIIIGKPYVICSQEINLSLPRKIISKGYHAIPYDMIPTNGKGDHKRNVWYYTQKAVNAVNHAKNNPNLYILFMSCFSCIPDSVMYHQLFEKLSGETFCYLEIDAHTAHAGFETRVGAFLDIVELNKNKKVIIQDTYENVEIFN